MSVPQGQLFVRTDRAATTRRVPTGVAPVPRGRRSTRSPRSVVLSLSVPRGLHTTVPQGHVKVTQRSTYMTQHLYIVGKGLSLCKSTYILKSKDVKRGHVPLIQDLSKYVVTLYHDLLL